jgi:AcrR family transcriptional regulator
MRNRSFALSRKQLYQRVWAKPLTSVAAELGVSGTALAKICNRLLVPYPPRGYWLKLRAGKTPPKPALPPAPETQTRQLTISAVRPSSRRMRTRLDPTVRREQLIEIAEQIIRADGLHAASMKRIASSAGISETQAYNYFGSREKLLVELARREFAKIRAARQQDVERTHDHYSRITQTTRTYLREIGARGDLLQTLLSSPEVRNLLRSEHREQRENEVHSHADSLVDLYGISRSIAVGTTVVLTRLCLNAGKLIADRKVSVEAGERLCLAMVLNGSRALVSRGGSKGAARVAQSIKAA